jgi:hypothetical protein
MQPLDNTPDDERTDPDARNIVTVFDGLPHAFERAQLGAEHARSGETIALDEF